VEVRNDAGEDGLCRRGRQRRRLTAHPATIWRSACTQAARQPQPHLEIARLRTRSPAGSVRRPEAAAAGAAGGADGAGESPRRGCIVIDSVASELPVACGRGLLGRLASAFVPILDHPGALAGDLPETALCAASRRPTTRSSAAPLTCVVVWGREALCGVVNPWRIDGKDGVAGSIPAGGSTPRLTSGNAGQFRVWRPVEWAMLVVLAFGVALGGRMPDREHFPG
jgi:hypothetical protein